MERQELDFTNTYQEIMRSGSNKKPTYDCKDENIKKARNNFKDIMASVSFQEIYRDIAENKTKRYLEKHGILDNRPDINQVLAWPG